MAQVDPQGTLKAGREGEGRDLFRLHPVRDRGTLRFFPIGPLEDGDPVSRHAAGLLQDKERILHLVEDLSQEDEIVGAVVAGEGEGLASAPCDPRPKSD